MQKIKTSITFAIIACIIISLSIVVFASVNKVSAGRSRAFGLRDCKRNKRRHEGIRS